MCPKCGEDQRDRPLDSSSGGSAKRPAVRPMAPLLEEEEERPRIAREDEESGEAETSEEAEPELDDAIFTPVEPSDGEDVETVDPDDILT